MIVDCMIEDARWEALGLPVLAEAAAGAVVAHLELGEVELALLACDDGRIAVLNADFRDKPTPTNVLSWPSEDRAAETPGGAPLAPEDPELGDIAIAFDTCEREAAQAGKPMADHVTHLVVHGMLHLLGYDHIDDADAALMEGLETEILGKMGLSDPYGGTEA